MQSMHSGSGRLQRCLARLLSKSLLRGRSTHMDLERYVGSYRIARSSRQGCSGIHGMLCEMLSYWA
jgi:hypothetical protein